MPEQMRQTVSGSQEITQLQAAINQQFDKVNQIAILNGLLLTGIALSTGSWTLINHKLARKPQGYMLTSISAGATVWADQAQWTDVKLALKASADVVVDLWVF